MIVLIREGVERKFPWPLAKVAFWLVLDLFSSDLNVHGRQSGLLSID